MPRAAWAVACEPMLREAAINETPARDVAERISALGWSVTKNAVIGCMTRLHLTIGGGAVGHRVVCKIAANLRSQKRSQRLTGSRGVAPARVPATLVAARTAREALEA